MSFIFNLIYIILYFIFIILFQNFIKYIYFLNICLYADIYGTH